MRHAVHARQATCGEALSNVMEERGRDAASDSPTRVGIGRQAVVTAAIRLTGSSLIPMEPHIGGLLHAACSQARIGLFRQ